MMNLGLTFADWHNQRNLDGGMYGVHTVDASRGIYEPENPAETYARPRIIQLSPGTILFRWVDRRNVGPADTDKLAGAWWSSKSSARQILHITEHLRRPHSGHGARILMNIAELWDSALDEVVCVRVMAPVKCFMGIGRDIYEVGTTKDGRKLKEFWNSRGVQIYIPNMSGWDDLHKRAVPTEEAVRHFKVLWVKPSAEFNRALFNATVG